MQILFFCWQATLFLSIVFVNSNLSVSKRWLPNKFGSQQFLFRSQHTKLGTEIHPVGFVQQAVKISRHLLRRYYECMVNSPSMAASQEICVLACRILSFLEGGPVEENFLKFYHK